MALNVAVVNTAADAQSYLELGYCPIECSFGSEGSVIDELDDLLSKL